jgi:hypothetical protein
MEPNQCSNCTYWLKEPPPSKEYRGFTFGLCRRYPPVHPPRSTNNVASVYPRTKETTWCGEYSDRYKLPAEES